MTEEPSSRRRFLLGCSSVGLTTLAGCIGSDDGVSGFVFRELDDVHTLQGTRNALLSEAIIDSSSLDLEPRQQIRLGYGRMTQDGEPADGAVQEVRPRNPAVFTLRETRPVEVANHEVVVSSEALNMMDARDGDRASFVNYAPHPDITTREGAKDNNEYIEQVIDDGAGNVCCIAPHGGQLHSHTARQANRVATRMGESAWVTRAFAEDNIQLRRRWYVPETEIHPHAYPKLNRLYSKDFTYVVSFTGFDSNPGAFSSEGVAIGGLANEKVLDTLRKYISSAIQNNNIEASTMRYETGSPENPSSDHLANRLSGSGRNGIEITVTPDLRENHWNVIADAVADGLEEILANE